MRATIVCGLLASVVCALGCGGAGRYGYARTYSALDAEERWVERANSDAVYDEVRRLPDQFQGQTLSFFGVVTGVQTSREGDRIALQVRTHQERHLCHDETDSSCRVTVSERDGGPFTAILTLRPEDVSGENRVQVYSLLRVFGTLQQGQYDDQGGPILRVEFYRHWPRGEYVTTGAASSMRR
jgi:hypothetical protein